MPEFIEYMYHGTRAPKERLYSEGIRPLSSEEAWSLIREALGHFGVDEETWRRRGIAYDSIKRRFDFAGKMVWVTDSFDNAVSYARRAPETISVAIEDILKVKYGYYRLRNEARVTAMRARISAQTKFYLSRKFGPPKVVKLDVRNMGLTGGVNVPIGEFVPPDRILDVAILPSKVSVLGRLELW